MGKFQFKSSRFIKTALLPKDYPVLKDDSGNLLPEIAVAGRSNVGKSSLLNDLFQSKGLVKTSSKPGKTQALNFFTLDKELCFVDLPGYGYAKVPLSVKKAWGPMVQTYLEDREQLKLVLFLFDIRRVPNEEDFRLIEWAAYNDISLVLILTKTDKLNHKEKRINTKKILETFNTENLHHLFYSVKKNQGRRELMGLINDALDGN